VVPRNLCLFVFLRLQVFGRGPEAHAPSGRPAQVCARPPSSNCSPASFVQNKRSVSAGLASPGEAIKACLYLALLSLPVCYYERGRVVTTIFIDSLRGDTTIRSKTMVCSSTKRTLALCLTGALSEAGHAKKLLRGHYVQCTAMSSNAASRVSYSDILYLNHW
jgi:hypothetical protein